MTHIGSAVLVLTDSGYLSVQPKAGPALKELLKYKVADTPVWAAPAVVGDQLLIKDLTTVTVHVVGRRPAGAASSE